MAGFLLAHTFYLEKNSEPSCQRGGGVTTSANSERSYEDGGLSVWVKARRTVTDGAAPPSAMLAAELKKYSQEVRRAGGRASPSRPRRRAG